MARFEIVRGYKRIYLHIVLSEGYEYMGNVDYSYCRTSGEYRFVVNNVFAARDLLLDVRKEK